MAERMLNANLLELLDSSSSSSSSDESSGGDSDEELYHILLEYGTDKKPRTTVPLYVENVVSTYDDITFISHFRVCRPLFVSLAADFEASEIFAGGEFDGMYAIYTAIN
jgi:hypothetical protein